MREFIKKIIVIGLSIVSFGMMPLYASDEKHVLKLEDAIKAGFVYSSQVSLNSQELELLRERLKSKENNSYEAYQTVYLQKAKNEQQAETLKDKITYDITNRYHAIVLSKREIAKLEHNILIMTKEIHTMQIKKEQGLIDTVQYESSEIELQDLKNSKQSKVETLNNDRHYFKLITGKDVTRYTLEDTLAYEIFRITGAIDCYMDSKIDDYLKGDNDLAQFAKDHILTETNQPVYYSEYLDKKYNVDKSLASIEDARKEMKDALMNSYSSLMNLEEQISTLQTKQELTQKQIKIAQVKCEIGLITELEYDKQLLNLEEIEFNLKRLINQYDSLKQVIQKPWSAISNK